MTKEGIKELLEQLRAEESWRRYSAVKALGELGKKVREVVTALIRLLREDKSGTVRARAAMALGELRAEEAVPELRKALREDKRTEVHAAARWALKQLEKKRKGQKS